MDPVNAENLECQKARFNRVTFEKYYKEVKNTPVERLRSPTANRIQYEIRETLEYFYKTRAGRIFDAYVCDGGTLVAVCYVTRTLYVPRDCVQIVVPTLADRIMQFLYDYLDAWKL